MKRFLSVHICSFLFISIGFLFAEKETIKVEASILDSAAVSQKKVEISIRIVNNSRKQILIPEKDRSGLGNDPIADFIIELEQYNGGKWCVVKIPDKYLPGYDKINLVTIENGKSLIVKHNIAKFYAYRFPSGKFRVRVLYKVSRFNNFDDVLSNWANFLIK